VATMATMTPHHRMTHHLLVPNHHGHPLLAPQRGDQVSSQVRPPAPRPPTRWETATTTATIAVLQPVKQARQTGLEMEAVRSLGLRGRLEEVEALRVPHRLVAGRGMNRQVSAGVVGGRQAMGYR
jgi:hypothetical protein